jgi:hypothetical protein
MQPSGQSPGGQLPVSANDSAEDSPAAEVLVEKAGFSVSAPVPTVASVGWQVLSIPASSSTDNTACLCSADPTTSSARAGGSPSR